MSGPSTPLGGGRAAGTCAWKRAEEILRTHVEKALDGAERPASMTVRTETGNPAEVLIRLGRTADLLVVGARGHSGFRHLLTGSVATQVVNHSPCPVVVVPTRHEA